MLQLIDDHLLFGDHRFDQVPDGDHTDNLFVIEYRQVISDALNAEAASDRHAHEDAIEAAARFLVEEATLVFDEDRVWPQVSGGRFREELERLFTSDIDAATLDGIVRAVSNLRFAL